MGIRVYFEGQQTLTIKKENFEAVKTALVELHRDAIKESDTLLNTEMDLKEVFSTFGLDTYPDSDGNLVGFAVRAHDKGPPPNITAKGETRWHDHCSAIFASIKEYMGDGVFAFVLGENSLYTKFSYSKDDSSSTTMNCEILDKDNHKDVMKLLGNYIDHALRIGIPIEDLQGRLDDIKVSEIVDAQQIYIYYVFGRYFTAGSELIIYTRHFEEGLAKIKKMDQSFHNGGRKEIQDATRFGEALYKLGWSAVYSALPYPHIRGLVYRRSNELSRDSKYVLYVIATIVEPGGYIKFIDSQLSFGIIYRFNDRKLSQDIATKKYIDIKSEQDLLDLLKFSIDNLYEINKDPEDLISFIKQHYIKKIMDL